MKITYISLDFDLLINICATENFVVISTYLDVGNLNGWMSGKTTKLQNGDKIFELS